MMINKPSLLGAAVGLLLAASSVWAHHSFVAQFDADKPTTLKGTLTGVELTNPHGWIHMDVTDVDGKIVNWAIETNNANALIRLGLRKTDFQPGSEIVVEGFLARNGTPTVSGRRITFADGRDFLLGASYGLGALPEGVVEPWKR